MFLVHVFSQSGYTYSVIYAIVDQWHPATPGLWCPEWHDLLGKEWVAEGGVDTTLLVVCIMYCPAASCQWPVATLASMTCYYCSLTNAVLISAQLKIRVFHMYLWKKKCKASQITKNSHMIFLQERKLCTAQHSKHTHITHIHITLDHITPPFYTCTSSQSGTHTEWGPTPA